MYTKQHFLVPLLINLVMDKMVVEVVVVAVVGSTVILVATDKSYVTRACTFDCQ
jgi:hypothetical protein